MTAEIVLAPVFLPFSVRYLFVYLFACNWNCRFTCDCLHDTTIDCCAGDVVVSGRQLIDLAGNVQCVQIHKVNVGGLPKSVFFFFFLFCMDEAQKPTKAHTGVPSNNSPPAKRT